MKQGIYDMTSAEYHAHKEAQSKSLLEHMLRSPAHYHYRLTHPSYQTPQMLLGSVVHTLVLEPHKFSDEYVIIDNPPDQEWIDAVVHGCYVYEGKVRRGKEWDAFSAKYTDKPILIKSQHDAAIAWMQKAINKQPISESVYEQANYIKQAVLANRVARGLIEHPDAVVEQSAFWVDEETGLLCKCRPDLRIGRRVYDLKTTRSAEASAFSYSAKKLGYHRQAAFYTDGLTAVGLEVESFGFIAVDTQAPMMATVFHRLSDDSVRLGREQIMDALNKVAACQFSGEWEGYPDEYDYLDIGGNAWDEDETSDDD